MSYCGHRDIVEKEKMPLNDEKEGNSGEFGPKDIVDKDIKTTLEYEPKIIWLPFIYYASLHLLAIYGLYIYWTEAKWMTIAWASVLGFLIGEAIIIGAHRGFCHRSFKATKGMQVILLALHAMGGQHSIYTWAKNHRVHHKYCDTDGDPYNINRSFFFAHVGYLFTSKHPQFVEKEAKIDVSDLTSNKLLMFQHRYFFLIHIILGLLMPVLVPVYGWNESFLNSLLVAYCLRCVIVLNLSWCVNSVAHAFGAKPYDKRITAVQSKFMWFFALGEGWHNFHHCFPWDYRSTEDGMSDTTTMIIDQLARWGLFYDLKTATSDMIIGHVKRHGDETHEFHRDLYDPHGISTIPRTFAIAYATVDPAFNY